MRPRTEVDHLSYRVHCHVCPGGWSAEKLGLPKTTDQHPRFVSRLIGASRWGGLWHCPDHNDGSHCECPTGDLTDEMPTAEQLRRHTSQLTERQ